MVNSFAIFKEYWDLITLLTPKEQANLLIAICEYMFEDKEPKLTDRENKIFVNLKRPLDKSKKRSKSGSITTSNENQNKIKMKSKQNQNEIKKGNKTKTHQDVSVYVNVNVDVYKEIIDYLNNKTNSNYKHTSKKTQDLIKARINEGFTIDDFKKVIDKKTMEWLRDGKMNVYLRPETLFGTKFEGYLNQPEKQITLKDITLDDIGGMYD